MTMTNDKMALLELIEKSADTDLVREMLGFAATRLMEAEVGARTGAAHGVRDPARQVQRNGYRERAWEGKVNLDGGRENHRHGNQIRPASSWRRFRYHLGSASCRTRAWRDGGAAFRAADSQHSGQVARCRGFRLCAEWRLALPRHAHAHA